MISIPTKIREIVQLVRNNGSYSDDAPYFDFGHHTYISNLLKDKSKSSTYYNKVFPMIALVLDIQEDRNMDLISYADVSFNIVIATATDTGMTNTEKETTIFKGILYPLYEALLTEMYNSHAFRIGEGNSGLYIPHTKTDMYFYNSAEGHNKWNRYVDAIELQFRNLKLNREC